jgi:hypothetical protein
VTNGEPIATDRNEPHPAAASKHVNRRKANHLGRRTQSNACAVEHLFNTETEHAQIVKRFSRFAKAIQHKGTIHPCDYPSTLWVAAGFSNKWSFNKAQVNSNTARSRCLFSSLAYRILWESKPQIEIALSMTENNCASLPQAASKVKPIMGLVQEMKDLGYQVGESTPTVQCTLFEDNSGALTLAKAPAMRPRTKHINVKYHHFRNEVADKSLSIKAVSSANQLADMLTKQSDEATFLRHRKAIMGW